MKVLDIMYVKYHLTLTTLDKFLLTILLSPFASKFVYSITTKVLHGWY